MNEMLRQLHTVGALHGRLLPRTVPQPEGWTIAARFKPGPWSGGDYYDFLPFPDGRILFLAGDASDQGGPATALVAMVRVVLHACPLSSGVEQLPFCPLSNAALQPPHILLDRLNRVLVENSLEEQYMTVFCGLLSPADGSLHFANAGHPAPRWWRAARQTVESLRHPAGLPLGVATQVDYHHKRIELEPGDVLVCYSDGVTAALDAGGNIFGAERLDDAIRRAAPYGAEAVEESILTELEHFVLDREVGDDLTLVILERRF
jgi:sigma-B regulation protein RsbU (phosphoserine phosphatase)